MKIQLYTCESGVDLFKKGLTFGAWDSNSKSYKSATENIVIFVDDKDVEVDDDGYWVTNVESVEIIG